MLEKFMSLFERVAIALERLAVVQSTGFLPPLPPKPVPAHGGLAHSEGGSKPPVRDHSEQIKAQAIMQQGQKAPEPTPAVDFMAPVPATAPAQQIAPSRDTVGNALVDLATADRDQAIKILAGFGAQKLGQVKESDYPALIQTLNKAIAALPPKVA